MLVMYFYVMYFNILFKFILTLLLIFSIKSGKGEQLLSRQKRHLIFPRGGTFKMVIGFAIPIKLGKKQSMACGWNIQFQYPVPTNITQLKVYPPIVPKSRKKREIYANDRALTYKALEAILNSNGINGRACLLRSICENAMVNTYNEANGLYGHLLHIALTPNYGNDKIESDLDPVYLEAKKAGEYGVDCVSLYPECDYGNGLFDMISVLDN